MFNRVRGLYARYADRHLSFTFRGHPLPLVEGSRSGFLDSVTIHGNHIRFAGWTTADQIALSWSGGQVVQRPHIPREDVAHSLGVEKEVGFAIEAPGDCGPYNATLRFGSAETTCRFAVPRPRRILLRQAVLRLRFLSDLFRALPATAMWYATHDPVYRARVKSRLGLDAITLAGPMNPALLAVDETERPAPLDCPITIVLPVYNAFELLADVLARVEAHTDLPWSLILVEDKSTDPRVRPFLRDWAATRTERVTLLENTENLGFIQSVNRGLTAARQTGRHVVLLNSDAFVPQNWASRLLRPIVTHDNVATTTPMSNDAEIFSVPAICTRTALAPGDGDAIDAVAAGLDAEAALVEAPTGVGFCMAMNRDFVNRIPSLDPVFGRGYGEEVDWCQKARAAGGRHLAVAALFVEHRGGESFGSEEKQRLILKNNALIAQRYPTYDRDVQQFIQADPLITARLALGLGYVGATARGPVPIYLAHSLGGGAEHYLQDRVRRELERGISSVILRVGGAQRFQVELRTPSGETSGTTDDAEVVQALLKPLRHRKIVYSCGVGDPDPVALPGFLLGLRNTQAGDEVELLIHDFFPISPSYCLLDKDGCYRGPVTGERSDPAHSVRRPSGERAGIAEWQAEWGRLVAASSRVTVFSEDSRRQVAAAYPSAAAKLDLQPHSLLAEIPRIERAQSARTVIGVLGNIGPQKGAKVVQDLARQVRDRKDLSIALIGNIDPRFPLPRRVPVHGNYRLSDLETLVRRYGITCWLIPSIWPETFSYTTHECLATGLPVFAFDIGAQGDAVRAAPNGRPTAFSPGADLAQSLLEEMDKAGLGTVADSAPAAAT